MLLASSTDLTWLKNNIAKFYCTEPGNINIDEHGNITNNNKPITSTKVIKKGKRYRFESVGN